MLGLRGVRLGLVDPGPVRDAGRAVAEAAARRVRDGGDPRPEIMVPLVAEARELATVRAEAEEVLASVPDAPPIPIGTMIETPRAALTAGEIAASADFFSFGTNDLTQMTWGFSRDDVEGSFLAALPAHGHLRRLAIRDDRPDGVGALVRIAVEQGRAAAPRPEHRCLRRARRRSRLHPLLPRHGPRLRLLLAVPGPHRPARSRTLRPG